MVEAGEAFRRELIEVNLSRIPWLLLVAMVLTLWTIASIRHDPALSWLLWLLVVDLFSAAAFLALNLLVRRRPPGSPLRAAYVWVTVALALGFMDGYYFLVGQSFGQNPVYILGVVMAATVFLLPPGLFLPVLLLNHLAFLALLRFAAPPDTQLLPVLIQNTSGAVVAGLVSVLLFRARREEFGQRQALAAANRTLEKRNRQLSEFMAITAHDLRSPLLGLRDLLGLARRAPAAGEILAQAARTCGDLLALANRLLDVHAAEARAEAGPSLETCDVRSILTAAVERAQPRAEARDVVLTLDVPEAPAVLPVDAPGLGQVLDNLLSNAVKFSPAGASVRVRLWRSEAGWLCDVEDRGPGIPPEERAFLFRKFHRGGAAASSGEAGSGLGLYIAATFMEAMGGQIAYEPMDPQGSRFRLIFRGADQSASR